MPVDVTKTLKAALLTLADEKRRIEHQAAAIQEALRSGNGVGNRPGTSGAKLETSKTKRGRRPMALAERKAVARRMKAYWAKRRAEAGKRRKAAS